jgi:hypothetical protein
MAMRCTRTLTALLTVALATSAGLASPAAAATKTWHKLTVAQLKKTVEGPGYAPAGMSRTATWFHFRPYTCGEMHWPAALSAQGTAMKFIPNGYREVLVEVDQVKNHTVAATTVREVGVSTCKGMTPIKIAGLPKGAVAWSNAPLSYHADINVELAVGDATITAMVAPANAFGKNSVKVLKHALAVTILASRSAALR